MKTSEKQGYSGTRFGEALEAVLVTSRHASATITSKERDGALAAAGVEAVLFSDDIPGKNYCGPDHPEEYLLAEHRVDWGGQLVAVVVGRTVAQCRVASEKIVIDYHPSPPILDVEHALAMQALHGVNRTIERGDVEAVLAGGGAGGTGAEKDEGKGKDKEKEEPGTNKERRVFIREGKVKVPSQLPFPPQTLWAEARLRRDGTIAIEAGAGIPSQIRSTVAGVLGMPESAISVTAGRLAGGLNGWEAEAGMVAALCALSALKTRHSVRLRVDRATDTLLRSKRHAAVASYKAAHDDEGRVSALDVEVTLDAGHTVGDSATALDRLLLHVDGAYFFPALRVTGQLCKTHQRVGADLIAEGSAQGAWIVEEILHHISQDIGLPPERVRSVNLYREEGDRGNTHYGQPVNVRTLARIWRQALVETELDARREEIEDWNREHPYFKRGLGVVPVKLGIGDPRSSRNQSAASVQLLRDGSVKVSVGLVDTSEGMGRRLVDVVRMELGVEEDAIRITPAPADELPHFTALTGADMGGAVSHAVADACHQLKQRLRPVAAQILAGGGHTGFDADEIRFADGNAFPGPQPVHAVALREVAEEAWRRRVLLMGSGFYRTPNLIWDAELGAGWPFAYFSIGAAVCEVELDAFTGQVRLLRADVFHDNGRSSQPQIDRSQVSRAFMMGAGWIVAEPLGFTREGLLETVTAETYAIPGWGNAPIEFNIVCGSENGFHGGVTGTGDGTESIGKDVREAPVILAMAIKEAAVDAIRAYGAGRGDIVELESPATPEAVLTSLRMLTKKLATQRSRLAAGPGPEGKKK